MKELEIVNVTIKKPASKLKYLYFLPLPVQNNIPEKINTFQDFKDKFFKNNWQLDSIFNNVFITSKVKCDIGSEKYYYAYSISYILNLFQNNISDGISYDGSDDNSEQYILAAPVDRYEYDHMYKNNIDIWKQSYYKVLSLDYDKPENIIISER